MVLNRLIHDSRLLALLQCLAPTNGPGSRSTTPSPPSSMSAMSARHGAAYGPMYRLEQSCTLSAA
jgi:hypothetical protein